MARQTKPPVVPSRPDKLRPQPLLQSRSRSPLSLPSSRSLSTPLPVSKSTFAQTECRTPAVFSRRILASDLETDRHAGEYAKPATRRQGVKGCAEADNVGPVSDGAEEAPMVKACVPARKPVPKHDLPVRSGDADCEIKDTGSAELPGKLRKEVRQLGRQWPETDTTAQALWLQAHVQANNETLSVQQRRDMYRLQPHSAEARALYAEAKDHYGKARNHLHEALKLSVDVLRLVPFVLVENAVRVDTQHGSIGYDRHGGRAGNRGNSTTFVPDYPGIGLQYQHLFAPLHSAREQRDRDRSQRARQKSAAEDALVRDHGAVARRAAASSGSASIRSNRTKTISHTQPKAVTEQPTPQRAPSRAVDRSRLPRSKDKTAPAAIGTSSPTHSRPTASRSTARREDGPEKRLGTRARSAIADRQIGEERDKEGKNDEADHGIMWFFSY